MIPDSVNIILGFIAMIIVGYSWCIHYKVKDGLARKMILWGCGLLFAMFFFRTTIYSLSYWKVITELQMKTFNQVNTFFLYVLILGQFFIQMGRSERNEDDKNQKDDKELIKLRKEK